MFFIPIIPTCVHRSNKNLFRAEILTNSRLSTTVKPLKNFLNTHPSINRKKEKLKSCPAPRFQFFVASKNVKSLSRSRENLKRNIGPQMLLHTKSTNNVYSISISISSQENQCFHFSLSSHTEEKPFFHLFILSWDAIPHLPISCIPRESAPSLM